MHADEQQSFFALADSLLLTNDNPEGTILFSQSQVCCCYSVDVDEQKLSLQRRIRNAEQLARSLATSAHRVEVDDASPQHLQQQLLEAQQLVESLTKELAALVAAQPADAGVKVCHDVVCGSL
jgi:hypothetical protein